MKHVLLLGLVFFAVSCTEVTSDSVLMGSWQTEACEQTYDQQGQPLAVWTRGRYQFSDLGTVRFQAQRYLDSNCTTPDPAASGVSSGIIASYRELGEAELQEGLSGYRIEIIPADPILFRKTEAFYTLDTGNLCFSSVFSFAPTGLSLKSPYRADIDFLNCLVRP